MSDLAPSTEEALLRLLLARVPEIARKAVPVPAIVLGSVEEYAGGIASVTLDGDTEPSPIRVAVPGGVAVDDRVVVQTYPPHGALVVGVLQT